MGRGGVRGIAQTPSPCHDSSAPRSVFPSIILYSTPQTPERQPRNKMMRMCSEAPLAATKEPESPDAASAEVVV